MNSNGCIIPEIDEQNIGVQQENATFLVIGDEAYTSEIIEEYNRNAAAKTEEFNTNATNKTNDFNTNYDNKLEAFNSNAVTKTEDFDSHVTAQTTNFNNNAETATTNFNKNAAQQTDEFNKNAMSYSQGIEENKKNIASTSNELYHLKTDILETGESSGNNIHLEDSAWAEMQEIKVDGVCEQNTTTGKNLFCMPQSATLNGITFNVNSDGSFNISGTATANATFLVNLSLENSKLKSGNTYTLSTNKELGDIAVNVENYSNTTWESAIFTLNKTLTKVTGAYNITDNTNIVRYSVRVASEKTVNLSNVKIQLEEGSAPTDYEPFTNGASPSPDYPQEIKTITGSLKVTSCGRNLLKNIATSATINGISFTVNDDGSVLANGTATADAILKIVPIATTFSQNLILSPNKTYTLSDSVGNYTDYFTQVVIQDANGNKNWYNTAGDIDISTNVITCLYTAQIYVRKDKTVNNVLFKPQLVVKDSANLFEPYIESQIEAKLPEGEFIGYINATNYDALSTKYNSNAGAYQLVLNKCIAKITIDGTKGSFSMPSAGRFNIDNIINDYLKTSQSYGITTKCDNYISFSQTLSNSDFDNLTSGYNYGIGLGGGTANNIRIKNVNFSNVEDFKNDLKQHPITLYYILNIESRRTLDLGVIDMPLTYDEITNIFTDSDLLPTINVKYYRNFIATIQNLQVNNDTLKNELSNIESRLTALESANTNIESRLTTLENANKNVADSNPTEESEVTE